MALLQISEPGKSTMPHEHRRVVGIDLGTTNSLVASVISGSPSYFNTRNESIFYLQLFITLKIQFKLEMRQRDHQSNDAENTISSVKRLIGKTIDDINQVNFPLRSI